MSYPKKNVVNKTKASPVPSTKMDSAKKEKLLAIYEKEQLKGLLINKFLDKYGKNQKGATDLVNKEVSDFMKNEKLTKDNLKKLEGKIQKGVAPQSEKKSQSGHGNEQAPQSHHQFAEDHDHHHHHHHHHDDAASYTSSQKPKSVYVQGDSDDEWATILKYDTELYKQERALEKAKEIEQKRKIKEELDRQIAEKQKNQQDEKEEMKRYNQYVGQQMTNFDKKEQKKENDMKNKIMHEKQSRDIQLLEEKQRRKHNQKVEKDMDELLVTKIRHELDEEARQALYKRQEEKEQLKRVLQENEEDKKKRAEEARREKEADTKAQQEYTRLIEKQMADREAEVKAREDRAKKFMSMMADTVVKDQKAQILEEERKVLKHYSEKEARDMEEERRRQQRLEDQKRETRKYLDFQMQERERKKEEERELERKQADFWKKDTDNYNNNEKAKAEYVRGVNKEHQEFLKKQIQDERKRQKKMNPEEALMNKPLLKEIATKNDNANFQKKLVK